MEVSVDNRKLKKSVLPVSGVFVTEMFCHPGTPGHSGTGDSKA